MNKETYNTDDQVNGEAHGSKRQVNEGGEEQQVIEETRDSDELITNGEETHVSRFLYMMFQKLSYFIY